ncbi:MAG: hypothetical protein CMJ39_07295 [Phycisphaerae bacterium]|nr:hypothetical protein [Phycisphaerae bacterium]
MARSIPSIPQLLMTMVAVLMLAMSSVVQAEVTTTGTSLPVQEQQPLGGVGVSDDGSGEASSDSGYLPNLMEFARVGGALVGVIGLLFGLRIVMRKMGGLPSGRRPGGVIHVHARYPIARGQQVLLIQVGQRIIVAHQGGGTMRTLSEITDPSEVARIRGNLEAGETRGVDTPDTTSFETELKHAAATKEVVDLTRAGRAAASAAAEVPARRRFPGWRGLS